MRVVNRDFNNDSYFMGPVRRLLKDYIHVKQNLLVGYRDMRQGNSEDNKQNSILLSFCA